MSRTASAVPTRCRRSPTSFSALHRTSTAHVAATALGSQVAGAVEGGHVRERQRRWVGPPAHGCKRRRTVVPELIGDVVRMRRHPFDGRRSRDLGGIALLARLRLLIAPGKHQRTRAQRDGPTHGPHFATACPPSTHSNVGSTRPPPTQSCAEIAARLRPDGETTQQEGINWNRAATRGQNSIREPLRHAEASTARGDRHSAPPRASSSNLARRLGSRACDARSAGRCPARLCF
jgi:hypothetical protein